MLPVSNLVELLQYRAASQPNQVAYRFLNNGKIADVTEIRYQALALNAQAIAAKLQTTCQPGARALLMCPSGVEFITAFFGCLYAGMIPVPAYPLRRNQSLSRLEAIVADAEPQITLTTSKLRNTLQTRFAESDCFQTVAIDSVDTVDISLASDWSPTPIQAEDIAFLQYTSGSVGHPKGVMVSHDNILYNQQMIQLAFGHTQETVVVGWLPMFHDMGLIGNVLQPLYVGFPGILMPPMMFLQRPVCWLEAISHYRATTSGGPNFAYDLCVNKITPEQKVDLDLRSWQLAFNGSEPVRAETLDRFCDLFSDCGFRPATFYPCYGMAEATLLVSGGDHLAKPVVRYANSRALGQNQVIWTLKPDQNDVGAAKAVVGCGQKSLGQTIVIVHPETMTRLDDEQVGEVWLQGPNIAQGYWQNSTATQDAFQAYLQDKTLQEPKAGPYLRTGDLGFFSNGELFITGRLKDIIVIRGRNYYPQDIEQVAEDSHPALKANSGAAFSIELEGQEHLIIVHEIKRSCLRQLNHQLEPAEITRALQVAISDAFDLHVYKILLLKTNSLLKTSSGKIQRQGCRRAFLDQTLHVISQAAPSRPDSSKQRAERSSWIVDSKATIVNGGVLKTRAAIEYWLVTRLSQYLKVSSEEIDPEELFSAFGIDSSVAVSMTGELAEWIGINLDPHLFWEYPSIASLAQYLETAQTNQSSSLSVTS